MNYNRLARNTFIFTVWTLFFFWWFRWFMYANWSFDIFQGWHWHFIYQQWWYEGWVVQGTYYWVFVICLFLAIPLWIMGFCLFESLQYKKLYEKIFWEAIYRRKTKKLHEDDKKIRIKKKKSYKEVRPKPIAAPMISIQKKPSVASSGGMGEGPSAKLSRGSAKNGMPSGSPFEVEDFKADDFEMPAPEKRDPLSEDIPGIMEAAGVQVLTDVMVDTVKLDYVGLAENKIYVCMRDAEAGDWLADEERFNNEDPLWFSESAHRVSPITILTKAKDAVLGKLAAAGFAFVGQEILIKTNGNIINAEDMMSTWSDMKVIVCRSDLGAPDELPSFAEAFLGDNTPANDTLVKQVKKVLMG